MVCVNWLFMAIERIQSCALKTGCFIWEDKWLLKTGCSKSKNDDLVSKDEIG